MLTLKTSKLLLVSSIPYLYLSQLIGITGPMIGYFPSLFGQLGFSMQPFSMTLGILDSLSCRLRVDFFARSTSTSSHLPKFFFGDFF
jgi:hypothetical protein